MTTVLLILAFVSSTILVPVLVPLLQKDIEDGLPWLAEQLVRRAVRKLPIGLRERYLEEWLNELHAIPVRLLKLAVALRIARRARATGREALGLPAWWLVLLRGLAQMLTTLVARVSPRESPQHKNDPVSREATSLDGEFHTPAEVMDVIVKALQDDPHQYDAALRRSPGGSFYAQVKFRPPTNVDVIPGLRPAEGLRAGDQLMAGWRWPTSGDRQPDVILDPDSLDRKEE